MSRVSDPKKEATEALGSDASTAESSSDETKKAVQVSEVLFQPFLMIDPRTGIEFLVEARGTPELEFPELKLKQSRGSYPKKEAFDSDASTEESLSDEIKEAVQVSETLSEELFRPVLMVDPQTGRKFIIETRAPPGFELMEHGLSHPMAKRI